ncbi:MULTISPECIES: hypothetical protein [Peribacillus]|uniref:hypothetical protein n=1 Tax=Peribacillus TaxID=2675229 RepID=UPI001F4EAFF2|nr:MULTISPECIES: hypothetical protein [unclassified Peribacillus]MCK1984685.1 hypothetical protein [Peribacillus sp. Aquil_B1]MCK2009016.1 hypothetical protein [Peribacillus sp. Aquil_B8]
MKKLLGLKGTLLLGLILMNVYTDSRTMARDGLEINTTYLKNSKELLANMSISGYIQKKKTLEIKTILKGKNTISIKKDQTGSELEYIIIDSTGEKVYSEKIKGDTIRSFESMSGEGIIKIVLSSGKQVAMININEAELNNE